MFRLELHCHCAPVSCCASAQPEQVIELYRQAGYQGLVSTNHINGATFQNMKDSSWEEKVDYFLSGYDRLRQAAGDDFDVLPGCEINVDNNDYLVFGITRAFLLQLGDPLKMHTKELSDKVRQAGLMIFQAHPFRYGMMLTHEEWLDGMEVYNAHMGHDSHNFMAELWAERMHLPGISGSDFHDPYSHIGAGIETRERIRDSEGLLKVLRSGDYQLIRA